jgi:hypothetical protein
LYKDIIKTAHFFVVPKDNKIISLGNWFCVSVFKGRGKNVRKERRRRGRL